MYSKKILVTYSDTIYFLKVAKINARTHVKQMQNIFRMKRVVHAFIRGYQRNQKMHIHNLCTVCYSFLVHETCVQIRYNSNVNIIIKCFRN